MTDPTDPVTPVVEGTLALFKAIRAFDHFPKEFEDVLELPADTAERAQLRDQALAEVIDEARERLAHIERVLDVAPDAAELDREPPSPDELAAVVTSTRHETTLEVIAVALDKLQALTEAVCDEHAGTPENIPAALAHVFGRVAAPSVVDAVERKRAEGG